MGFSCVHALPLESLAKLQTFEVFALKILLLCILILEYVSMIKKKSISLLPGHQQHYVINRLIEENKW